MNRVEYESNPTRRDMERLSIYRLLNSRITHIYYVVILIFTHFWVLQIRGKYEGSDLETMIFIAVTVFLILVLSPFALFLGMARRRYKLYQKRGKGKICLDQQGCSLEDKSVFVKFGWGEFTKITETSKYIFVKMRNGPCLNIYKYLLPTDTVRSIKEILKEAPVPNIKLLND